MLIAVRCGETKPRGFPELAERPGLRLNAEGKSSNLWARFSV
jgi:hypothetical protein